MTRLCLFPCGLLVAAAGCSPARAPRALTLSWQLVDGRDCPTSGITRVEVRPQRSLSTPALAQLGCSDGLVPAVVTVANAPGATRLFVDGRSTVGTELYHGEVGPLEEAKDLEAPALVTLYAVAAE